MDHVLKVTLAQINPSLGAIIANLRKHIECAQQAINDGSDLIVFPELSICGYPPEDLLLRRQFEQDCSQAVVDYAKATPNIHSIIGAPMLDSGQLFNAAFHAFDGKIQHIYKKEILPNYGVFDERRYFSAGQEPCVIDIRRHHLAITICEDLWETGPAQKAKDAGASVILSLNASPFEINKHADRLEILRKRCAEVELPIVYVNQLGGQDELVFDGGSLVLDKKGQIHSYLGTFAEARQQVIFEQNEPQGSVKKDIKHNLLEEVYNALVLGVRDYINKSGFPGAVIGLSGGIDSALTLAIACEAIGAKNVTAVMMPTHFTSEMSHTDAKQMVATLGVDYHVISIENSYTQFKADLKPIFKDKPEDVTEQNIQARCRGIILMALSNKFGRLVLTTGNKSELAVGYCTLYGDMAGGFAVLKDVPKTLVYELAKFINQKEEIIPVNIIQRPPSAELAEGQLDQDSLPPYDILDQIIEYYIDQEMELDQIVKLGIERNTADTVIKLIKRAEYKRRQSPPGVRINHKAFGRDRRYPITSAY